MRFGFDPEQPGAVRLREQVQSIREELVPTEIEILKSIGLPDGRAVEPGDRVTVPAHLARWLITTGRALAE